MRKQKNTLKSMANMFKEGIINNTIVVEGLTPYQSVIYLFIDQIKAQ